VTAPAAAEAETGGGEIPALTGVHSTTDLKPVTTSKTTVNARMQTAVMAITMPMGAMPIRSLAGNPRSKSTPPMALILLKLLNSLHWPHDGVPRHHTLELSHL
jgi:hypothetical protein